MKEELDIFISCKDTDDKGNETIDLKISREIAKILRSENFKVFLSDQTLSELGSSQYKKTIDEALDRAKAMVVVASKSEYAESNWVRYEWDTFYNDYLSGHRQNANIFTVTINLSASTLPRTLRNSQCYKYESEVDKLLIALKTCIKKEEEEVETTENKVEVDNSPRFSLIPPEEITKEDIREVLLMESEVYTENEQQELEHCLELYKINPYIYLFFKDNNTGQIVGNIDIDPVSEECYELIRSGHFYDSEITTEMLLPYDMPALYDIYFCGIMIRKEYRNSSLFLYMFNAVIDLFMNLGERGILPRKMIADAVTENGIKFCKLFGMEKVKESDHQSSLYEVSLIPPEFRVSSRATKTLHDYFQAKYEENKDFIG